MWIPRAITAFLTLLLPAFATACWQAASSRYGMPVELLHAVARVESGLNPKAINRSHEDRTGTRDIGLMQINTSHLKMLSRLGISEASLYEPCVSLHVGAWLLAQSFARYGTTWNAVGAYNAACDRLKGEACTRTRAAYAWKVYRWMPAPASLQGEPRDRDSGSGQPRHGVDGPPNRITPVHEIFPRVAAEPAPADAQRLREGSVIGARIRSP